MTLENHLSLQKCKDGFTLLSDLYIFMFIYLLLKNFWLIFKPVLQYNVTGFVIITFVLMKIPHKLGASV